MRYIVISLLALNLLYLVYNLLMPGDGDQMLKPDDLQSEVSSIRLLQESTDKDVRQRQMDQVVKNPMFMTDALEPNCHALGPFPSVTLGQAALERLEVMDYLVELRAIDQLTGEHDYRVMIPPVASLEEAFRNLRELQSRGIDSYVITQGQDTLGISLGVFSITSAAEDVHQELGENGYETFITQIARMEREYWIFAGQEPDLEVDNEILQQLKQAFPDIALSLQMCL